jgi:hypothetical protein
VQVKVSSPNEEPTPKTVETLDSSADKPAVKAGPSQASTPSEGSEPADEMSSRTYDMQGRITAVNCASGVPGTLTLNIQSVLMKFHYSDFSKVELSGGGNSTGAGSGALPTCASLKGRRAKVKFHPAPNKGYDGELISVHVF